jgi:hypothetical protein
MSHDPGATERALEHDIEVLEDRAKVAAEHIAIKVVPIAALVIALLVVAWILGRRSRER